MKKKLISAFPSLYELSDERVKLLGKLFLSFNQTDRDALISIAKGSFKRGSPYAPFAPYLFTFLAKYHDLDVALNCAILHIGIDEIGLNTLHAISNLLRYDSGYPSDSQINCIATSFSEAQETLKSVWEHKQQKPAASSSQRTYFRIDALITRIVQQAQEIKYRRLKEHLLNDTNLEINQDRQKLTTGLAKFGFGKELIESLDHAEDEYRKADSKFDFKTAVDHNRSFLETLLWETAGKVASIRNESLTARQKYPVEIRSYLHKAGFFSDRFHELCTAFYGFASEQSIHQLASGREIARIVRNMK